MFIKKALLTDLFLFAKNSQKKRNIRAEDEQNKKKYSPDNGAR